MKYYAAVTIKLNDDSWLAEYGPVVGPLVEKHGGRYLARSTEMETIEGDSPLPDVFVIIEWPSKEAAQAFYSDPEYQPQLRNRLAGTSGDFVLLAGVDE